MKAMTWLKVGGGVLVALAAFAAADTRYVEITGQWPGDRHVIASRADACKVLAEASATNDGCCKSAAENSKQQGHSGCCRK
jgi:hypothetical protein